MESMDTDTRSPFAKAEELTERLSDILGIAAERRGPEDNPSWHLPTELGDRVYDISVDVAATARVDGTVMPTDTVLATVRAIAAQKRQ